MKAKRVSVPVEELVALDRALAEESATLPPRALPRSRELLSRLLAAIAAREAIFSAEAAPLPGLPGHADAPALRRRERETLTMLLAGASEKEIASALGISVHTVHQYVKVIYRRFEVRSRAQLLARELHRGAGDAGGDGVSAPP